MLSHKDIADCFNELFVPGEHTWMIGGAPEPSYRPGWLGALDTISYRSDYAQSALHEAAHWCLAGRRRRRLPDYGYWYSPPPRTAERQAQFFCMEIRVQALEWLFAIAAGVDFHPSADDPLVEISDFRSQLLAVRDDLKTQLPERAVALLTLLEEKRLTLCDINYPGGADGFS